MYYGVHVLYYIILYIVGLAPRTLSRGEERTAITIAVSALTAFQYNTYMHTIISPRPWDRIIYNSIVILHRLQHHRLRLLLLCSSGC